MKKKLYTILLCAFATLGIASCANLGFGVDAESGVTNPYWYGNGYLGDTYWNTPVWNYGPIYHPNPPVPPFINPGPGPAVRPTPPAQQPPQETPGNRPGNVFPGVNRVPTQINGIQRPGNGGLATPGQVAQDILKR